MQVTAAVHHDRTLTLPRVLGLLAALLVLAIALPYGAVQTLHARRLNSADAGARDIADRLGDALRAGAAGMPAGTQILAGPGDQPRATDERWGGTATFPLARVLNTPVLRPDPWGNAYLAKVGPGESGALWVITAGPDGILQTPFAAAGDRADGDDRIARIK